MGLFSVALLRDHLKKKKRRKKDEGRMAGSDGG